MNNEQTALVFYSMITLAILSIILFVVGQWVLGIVSAIISIFLFNAIKDE